MKTDAPSFAIRAYTDVDEPAVLRLLDASLGGGPAGERPAEFFRWKHITNPFGRSFMIVADLGGEIIGLRAFMRWEFVAGGQVLRGVRAVDTATHPDHQGKGIFSKLTRSALDQLAVEADFVFNTPNEKSMPGYLKMGWKVVAALPVHIRLARPVRFAMRAAGIGSPRAHSRGGGLDARQAIDESAAVIEPLLEPMDDRITTRRSLEYLRWRYADAPLLGYRGVRSEGGLAIYRTRARFRWTEATVAEVFAPDAREAARLLRAARKESGADHLAAHFAAGTVASRAMRRAGAVRAPRGLILTSRPFRNDIAPDPLDVASWALTTGDVEVF